MVRMVKLRMGKMKILDKVSARKTFVHPDTDETVSDRETYPLMGRPLAISLIFIRETSNRDRCRVARA